MNITYKNYCDDCRHNDGRSCTVIPNPCPKLHDDVSYGKPVKTFKCKHCKGDFGACYCEDLISDIKMAMNDSDYTHYCPYVGEWGIANIMCKGYEKYEQYAFICNNDVDIRQLTFDSIEEAKKYFSDNIKILNIC